MFKIRKDHLSNFYTLIFAICLLSISSISGKTRWSSLHIVPDADLFSAGEFTLGFDGFIAKDTSDKVKFKYSIPVRFGITEWVNLDVAYCGGMSVGIKGRILGETHVAMPSIAIGVHNLFNNKEANYFSVDSADDMVGEVYLALSKSIDPIKTRFHLGIQSIPTSDNDKVNPYFAVEKYFGLGLYSSLEFYRRDREFNISLFANWRVLNNYLEISFGAVDLKSMFFDENNKFAVSLAPSDPTKFLKPGFWIGIKFHGRFGLGSNKGFMSVEDRMRMQDEQIEQLIEEYDSMSVKLDETLMALDDVKNKMGIIIDSVVNDPKRIENIVFDKLVTLKALYSSEPYDPDKVKLLIREIASYREKAVPTLEGLLVDTKTDRYIRMYSTAILGEIGNTASSDILLDMLAKTSDPDIRIEILIALGKMKETRAMYLMEQLANSPNDAIAITAQDVLLRLSKETGAEISSGLKMRRVKVDEGKVLAEKKKGVIPDSLFIPDTVKAKPATPKVDKADTSTKDTTIAGKKAEGAIEETDLKTGTKDTILVDKKEEIGVTPKEETLEGAKTEEVTKDIKTASDEKKKEEETDKRKKRREKKEKKRGRKKDKEKEEKKRDRKKDREKEDKSKETKEEMEKNW